MTLQNSKFCGHSCEVNLLIIKIINYEFLGLTTADQTLVNELHVVEPPALPATTAAGPTSDMKQFLVYWRNRLRDLAYDNRLYDTATSNRIFDTKFKVI